MTFITGGDMSESDLSKEERILRIMRKVLTDVAKDTYTQPGLKHPLSEDTILSIRDCLALITARQQELSENGGQKMDARPRYIDEPQDSVVVPFHKTGLSKKSDKE